MLKQSASFNWYLGYIHFMLSQLNVPMWIDIYVTENISYKNNSDIESLGDLIHFEDYHNRFEELATKGWSWLNLSAVGLYNGNLILSIECPSSEPDGFETSINVSGPAKAVVENGFKIQLSRNG